MIQATVPGTPAADASVRAKLAGLRGWNVSMGTLHLAQGVAMLALASSFSLPGTSSFLRMDTATDTLVAVPEQLFLVQIAPLVAAFLFLSALAHAPSSLVARLGERRSRHRQRSVFFRVPFAVAGMGVLFAGS